MAPTTRSFILVPPTPKEEVFKFECIECFMTTFLHTHSWLNWVDEDDDEVGLKEAPECEQRT